MWRTKHLQFEEWHCEKCGKELTVNRYRLSDLSPIKFCLGCESEKTIGEKIKTLGTKADEARNRDEMHKKIKKQKSLKNLIPKE